MSPDPTDPENPESPEPPAEDTEVIASDDYAVGLRLVVDPRADATPSRMRGPQARAQGRG